jgi:hypothetical protein
LNIRLPFFFREEESAASIISVPWNTSKEDVISEYVSLEGKDAEMNLSDLDWELGGFDPLVPGLYFLEARYQNDELESPSVQVPVMVLNKPSPLDVILSNQKISKDLKSGQVVGILQTEDPADNIHAYTLEPSEDFELDGNEVIWIGEGELRNEYIISVTSIDRVGQTISKEIPITREFGENEVTVFPNPANRETNIKVDLIQANIVSIKVFDSAGRLVFEESEYRDKGFTRNLNLQTFSAGLYQVQVQIGFEVLTKRLVKVE